MFVCKQLSDITFAGCCIYIYQFVIDRRYQFAKRIIDTSCHILGCRRKLISINVDACRFQRFFQEETCCGIMLTQLDLFGFFDLLVLCNGIGCIVAKELFNLQGRLNLIQESSIIRQYNKH